MPFVESGHERRGVRLRSDQYGHAEPRFDGAPGGVRNPDWSRDVVSVKNDDLTQGEGGLSLPSLDHATEQ